MIEIVPDQQYPKDPSSQPPPSYRSIHIYESRHLGYWPSYPGSGHSVAPVGYSFCQRLYCQLLTCISKQDYLWILTHHINTHIQMQPIRKREDNSALAWFCFKTWRPFRTLRSVLITSTILGLILLILSALQFYHYMQTESYGVVYASNEGCIERSDGGKCQTILEIKEDIEPPIVVTYFIQNAYINHRKYVDSVSKDQLMGKTIDINQAKKECPLYYSNEQMGENKSYTGAPLDPQFIASPCGLTARLLFNDTFTLTDSKGSNIPIDTSKLYENIYSEFAQSPGGQSTQWENPTDEHFMIWMKNTGLLTKYKLWGRINQKLPAGKYNLVSANNYHIGNLKILKGFQIVKTSALGGPLLFYPVVFLFMGLACIAFTIFMKIKLSNYDNLLEEYDLNKQK